MTISFLIVNLNGGEVFKRGVASIAEECKNAGVIDYEIVVVDNASTDDTSWLEKVPRLKLIRNKKNEYFSVPTNDTVKYSRGDILFILNNDVILQKGSLKIMMVEIGKSEVDAVVPQLLYPDGSIQKSITGIPTWKDVFGGVVGLHIISPKKDKWRLRAYDYSRKHLVTNQPMFSALMLKRSVWDEVGGLDPKLPLLWNDVDWFYRFHLLKKKCWYIPEAKVIHMHGMSVNKFVWKKLYLLSEGSYVFLTKHADNKSLLFKTWIFLICFVSFFERIPVEVALRISKSLDKGVNKSNQAIMGTVK